MENEQNGPPELPVGQRNSIILKSPDQFSFVPEAWPTYRTKMVRWFRIFDAKYMSEADKMDTLLYTMGDKADKIMATFKDRVTEETKKIC
jgi:hypothetical protein